MYDFVNCQSPKILAVGNRAHYILSLNKNNTMLLNNKRPGIRTIIAASQYIIYLQPLIGLSQLGSREKEVVVVDNVRIML